MNFTSRPLRFAVAVGIALAASLPTGVHAQSWPNKPITLIVPFPAGGTTDVLARSLAEPLARALGQPVIVESKPGAGATIGADFVAKAKPDGHTLLVGAVHHAIATSVYKKLPYDFQKSFVPITTIALVPNVLTVSAANPAKSVAELIAQGKAAIHEKMLRPILSVPNRCCQLGGFSRSLGMIWLKPYGARKSA